MSLNNSPTVGGVYDIAFAPEFIASRIVSSDFPPVAIIAISLFISLIILMIFEVFSAPETLNISTPALIRPSKSSFSETTVIMIGISIISLSRFIKPFDVGLFNTTPSAP